ncbi:MAG: RNA 2',3'-cyclic phosphodiesterase [Desulfobacterales bacterium]|nr:RNA 2',3'-cyclic phosphodiesterase [Desulfobacterales bacterium]
MRTFIAIELPQHIIAGLGNVQKTLKSAKLKIRWVQPENIHLTLKFLGDINPEAIDPINRTLSESARGYDPISLSAKGGGAFPGIKNPRVIWVGLAGQVSRLKALQGTLAENLTALGYEKEERTFKGHLTLGRIKGAVDPIKLNAALNEVMSFETEPFLVDRIFLFQSDLKPTGPVYTKIASAALAPSL